MPPAMNSRACFARSMPSSHKLRQIASALDNCSLTTVDEKLSNVTTPLIVNHGERMEELREVDGPRAEVAAIAFADMNITKAVAALQNRLHEVGFLDVHVIRIEVDDDVRRVDFVNHRQALAMRC